MPPISRNEDGPLDQPFVRTAPTIRDLETDVRVRLRIDIRRLLEDGHVDSTTGEPTPEELQALVITTIARELQARVYVLAARVDYLDVEYQVRALDAERI